MLVLEVIIATVVCLGVPLLVGEMLLHGEAIGKCYIMGMFVTLAIAQIVYFPLVYFRHQHYTPYYWVYITVVGLLCVYSIFKYHKEYLRRFRHLLSVKKRIGDYNLWMILSILIIVIQIIRGVLGRFFVYADDVLYIPVINDMLETDVYSFLSWKDGYVGFVETDRKYLFTTYFPYLATICKLSGLHPAILVQTVFPSIMTIVIYSLVWCYGMMLFDDRKKSWVFVFFFAFLIETMSGYLLTFANHVIVSNYYGKKLVFTILLPFILLYIAEKTLLVENNVSSLKRKDVLMLIVMDLGICAPSLMGTGLAPVLLFAMGVVLCVRKKSIIPMRQVLIAMIPSIVMISAVAIYLYK